MRTALNWFGWLQFRRLLTEVSGGRDEMAKNEKRVKVTLACEDCKRRNYITTKNKQNDRERIEMRKYCQWDRKHTVHKETR